MSPRSTTGYQPKPVDTAPVPAACAGLQHTYGDLFSKVAIGIVQAQDFVNSGTARDNVTVFMQLAKNSRELGRVAGQLDACGAIVGAVDAIRKQFKSNNTELILAELKLNTLWSDKQYAKWLIQRGAVQNYHRVIAKLQGWLTRIAAAAAAAASEAAAKAAADASNAAAQVAADEAAKAAADAAAAALTPAADVIAATNATEAIKPFYKKPWFWGSSVAVLGVSIIWAIAHHRKAN